MMFFSYIIIYIFKYIVITNSSNKFNVSGICGYPGEPNSAQHNIDNRALFREGDVITYQCVDFLSYKQERRCHNGKWIGPQARCGYGIDNDVNKVVIEDCLSHQVLAVYDSIKLDKNNDRFANSFSTDRYNDRPIRASNSTCFRWHLHLNKRSHFFFVRIDFAIVFESVTKSNKEVPIVSATVDPLNNKSLCEIMAQKKYKHILKTKWIDYGNKYHYYFNCQMQTHSDKGEKLPNVFTIETSVKMPLTIDLVRFAIADIYGTVEDPACGLPEIPFDTNVKVIKEQQMYKFNCNELTFTNATQESSTYISCSSDALWRGNYPKCKPKQSCDNSLTIKNSESTLIDRIENVYYLNESIWYAIEGSVINYNCNYNHFDMFGSKTRRCLSTGLWDTKEPPICRSYQFDLILSSTQKQSIKFLHFLPFYIIAGITSLVLIIIAISAFIYMKRRVIRKQYNDPNEKQCPSLAPPSSCVTDVSYLEDSESIFHFQYQYHNEPIYDIPPNYLNSVQVTHNRLEPHLITEPIYDAPKHRDFNSDN